MAESTSTRRRREREKDLRRRMTATASAMFLYVLPTAMMVKGILALIFANVFSAGASFALFVVFILGAMLTRAGIARAVKIEAGHHRGVTVLPLKAFGASLYALAAFAAAYFFVGHELIQSILFAAGTYAGVAMTYGFDPYPKRGELPEGAKDKYFRDAMAEAQRKIKALEDAADEIGQREFRQRIHRIADIAHDVVGAIEDDPKDLSRARKFLHVYLDNGMTITQRYVQTHKKTDTGALENNFRELLEDMERTFEETYQRLLQNDLTDLDIHIDVLQTRMRREGVI